MLDVRDEGEPQCRVDRADSEFVMAANHRRRIVLAQVHRLIWLKLIVEIYVT